VKGAKAFTCFLLKEITIPNPCCDDSVSPLLKAPLAITAEEHQVID